MGFRGLGFRGFRGYRGFRGFRGLGGLGGLGFRALGLVRVSGCTSRRPCLTVWGNKITVSIRV